MNNFTYAVGRAAALLAFLAPLIVQIFPPGWADSTLGFVFHVAVTWLNEWAHEKAPETEENSYAK
jgi:hypothetical protein